MGAIKLLIELFFLGFFILAASIVESVGIFTPNWFTSAYRIRVKGGSITEHGYGGIVPYLSAMKTLHVYIDSWLESSSILLYTALTISILNIFVYLFTVYKVVKKSEFDRSSIRLLHLISICSALSFFLTLAAVIIIKKYSAPGVISLNSSYYICAIGSAVYPAISVISGLIAWSERI